MAKSPLDELIDAQHEERFPPPYTWVEWTCHVGCWILLVWGLYKIVSNLEAFRSVQQSPRAVGNASEAVLWILYGSAVFTYLLFAALTPFPQLYNYPFRLKPGEERVVFSPTRRFAHTIALLSILLLVLIIWDIVGAVVRKKPSLAAPLSTGFIALMLALTAIFFVWILRAHARYLPPDHVASRPDD